MNNNLKARLKKGENLVGTIINFIDNPEIAKVFKVCGFDFFMIDCEHTGYDYSAVARLLSLAREVGICAIVRVPEPKRAVILKYMEMGAGGLMLPNVETREEAEKLVEYSKYAPLGNRGVSLLRPAAGFEHIDNPAEYMKEVNEETILVIQIESLNASKNVDQLLAVEGIDAAFIGPNDLSQSMGMIGQYNHPDFIAAVDRVAQVAKELNKFSGMQTGTPEGLEPWIAKGMTLNLWSSDLGIFMNTIKAGVSKLKK
jgi:2,4-dihydroxyhept-2-ene-1,7-dioic acid aldolase